MPHIPSDTNRRLVPRLRTFAQAVVSGELGSLNVRSSADSRRDDFDEKFAEWQIEPTLGLAVDLMSSAVALESPKEVERIAWWTLHHRDAIAPSIILLAESCTSPELEEQKWQNESLLTAQELLKRARNSIREVGADAITLVDMSYAYLVLGKRQAAERAIKTALRFAPNSRLVLRAAARLWDHLKEPEVAREILLRSDRSKVDPWLVAAEIALASRAGVSPKLFKVGEQILNLKRFSPKHLSELAGAIGTQILLDKKRSKAQPYFETSLVNPTENAIAQAGWAQRRKLDINFDIEQWSIRRPDEARAWSARTEGKWLIAIGAADRWLSEEPFSSNAAQMGMFIASVLADSKRELEFALRGWQANSRSMMWANNLAFAEIMHRNNFDKAEKLLERARYLESETPSEEVAVLATRGLLKMRRGQLEEGRSDYSVAIATLKKLKNNHAAAWAAAFRAREERRIASSEADKAIREFDAIAGNSSDPAFAALRTEFSKAVPVIQSTIRKLVTALKRVRLKQAPAGRTPHP